MSRPEGTTLLILASSTIVLAVQTALTKGRRPGCLSSPIQAYKTLEWQQEMWQPKTRRGHSGDSGAAIEHELRCLPATGHTIKGTFFLLASTCRTRGSTRRGVFMGQEYIWLHRVTWGFQVSHEVKFQLRCRWVQGDGSSGSGF